MALFYVFKRWRLTQFSDLSCKSPLLFSCRSACGSQLLDPRITRCFISIRPVSLPLEFVRIWHALLTRYDINFYRDVFLTTKQSLLTTKLFSHTAYYWYNLKLKSYHQPSWCDGICTARHRTGNVVLFSQTQIRELYYHNEKHNHSATKFSLIMSSKFAYFG